MKKNINIVALIICIAVPLVVGFISSMFTRDAMTHFDNVNKPLLSPPGYLFPIVWTILYILMGISLYIVFNYTSSDINLMNIRKVFIVLFIVQLIFNFFWSIIFFGYKTYYFAFIWLILLWLIVLIMAIKVFKISAVASVLLIPYILWMSFAAYLNISIGILN